MNASHTNFPRLAAIVGLVVAIAALAVPAALGGTTSGALADRRSPDTRDTAGSTAQLTTRDALDPAIAASIRARHMAAGMLGDVRSPDTRDTAGSTAQPATRDALDPAIAAGIRARQNAPVPVDGRSPDTKDAPQLAQITVAAPATTEPGGIVWRDFGIGFAAASGAFLLLAAAMFLLPTARSHRKGASRAATA